MEVDKLVTDAHPQIAATMKRTEAYQDIQHQWDIWHGSKNLVKNTISYWYLKWVGIYVNEEALMPERSQEFYTLSTWRETPLTLFDDERARRRLILEDAVPEG